MTELLREKQLGYLTLEVRPSNEPALKLYEAFGFRQVGRRPNYYKNPREDALLLTKFFEEGPESC
jgi:ribosomal-protein-alanine N-acetyltransferase